MQPTQYQYCAHTSIALRFITLLCIAVCYSAVQCSVVSYSTAQDSAFIAVHCRTYMLIRMSRMHMTQRDGSLK